MELHLWFSLVLICLLGAMSPGPSLALVIKNTIKGGTSQGYATAISHGLAVGLYAAITATGIGIIIVQSPTLYSVIQYAGAAFLFYLGAKSLWAAKIELMTKKANLDAGDESVQESDPEIRPVTEKVNGWRDGFLIAFLNPKLAIFFLALFSQFVDEGAHWTQNAIMASTVGTIDLLWYVLITFGISRGGFIEKLKRNSVKVDIVTGIFLILLAMRVVMS
ncbi:MAG: LysE family translocator [Colwellia sp.]